MGIVKKQTILSSAYIYIGVALGFFSNIFFKPFALTTTEIGILSLIDSVSGVAAIVCSLGLTQVILRKFSLFKTSDGTNNGFLVFITTLSIFGFSAFLLTALFFPDFINQTKGFYNDLYFVPLIGITVFFRVLYRNLDVYVRLLQKPSVSIFFDGFIMKLVLFTTYFSVRYGFIDFHLTFILTVISYCIPGIALLIYTLNKSKFTLPTPKLRNAPKKDWVILSLFGLITSTSTLVVFYTDQLMINYILGPAQLGIYSIMFFIGVFINIPSRGFKGVATSFLSDYWFKNEISKISDFYKRSSNNQGVIAVYIFFCIWISITEITQILPPEYAAGKYVVLFIALAQVTDMITGINSEIISTSPLYRWNAYFNVILVFLTIINNLIFIQLFEITGAAMASFFALLIVNTSRYFLLYYKYNLNPFSMKTVYLFLILGAGIALMLVYPIQTGLNPFIAIIIKCSIVSIVFWLIIIKLKMSEDINELLFKYYNKLFRKN